LDVEERIRVIEEAANLYHGDVPVGLVLAIAAQETGEQYDPPWNNEETNGDGIMQVTEDSGFDKHKPYKNTRSSIEENMLDATDYLKDILATVRRYPGYGDYGDIFQEIPQWDLVRTPLHYNGGPSPVKEYRKGKGDPRYLGRVAGHLDTGGTVGRVFGHEYTDPVLAEALRAGQSEFQTNFPDLFKD
jgi:hypothetical protein